MSKDVFSPQGKLYQIFPQVEDQMPSLLSKNTNWSGNIVFDTRAHAANSYFTRLQCRYKNKLKIAGLELDVLIHRFWRQPLTQDSHEHRGAFASRNYATRKIVEATNPKDLEKLKLVTHHCKLPGSEKLEKQSFHHKERYSIESAKQLEHFVVPHTDCWTLVVAVFDPNREKSKLEKPPIKVDVVLNMLNEARFVYC